MQSKKSLFYQELTEPFAISLLAVEIYAALSSAATSEDEFAEALIAALEHGCGIHPVEVEHCELFLAKLEDMDKSRKDASAGSKPTPKRGVTMGTSFAEYLQSHDTVGILGRMTSYDLDSMRALYCKTDAQQVLDMVDKYVKGQMEMSQVMFEACLYGAGNSYKDDKPVNTIDPDSPLGAAMLGQLGIGTMSLDALDALRQSAAPASE